MRGCCRSRRLVSLPYRFTFLALSIYLCLSAPAWAKTAPAQQQDQLHSLLQVPASIAAEHKELHAELAQLTQSGGRTAAAARKLEEVLHPHFAKEDKYALPLLGLLAPLSEGKATEDMRPAIALSAELKAQLPQMDREHQAIKAAAEQLESAGRDENKPKATAFAEQLLVHAQTEEQVLYPSAILIGEYLKLRLGSSTTQ